MNNMTPKISIRGDQRWGLVHDNVNKGTKNDLLAIGEIFTTQASANGCFAEVRKIMKKNDSHAPDVCRVLSALYRIRHKQMSSLWQRSHELLNIQSHSRATETLCCKRSRVREIACTCSRGLSANQQPQCRPSRSLFQCMKDDR